MKLLKKIRRMAHSQKSDHSATNNLPPITFHSVHGEYIRISSNGSVATRVSSYCKGICFSNRPIRVNERVCIRFLEMSSQWSGLLRFGFTSKDPATFRSNSLPKYACPDLTNSGHTFAKALPDGYAQKNNILHFYVSSAGNVHYSINSEDKGVILTNVKINGPLWAIIDVYGNTSKIESLDPRRQQCKNRAVLNNQSPERIYSSVSMMDLPDQLSREPSPQIYSEKCLDSMQFHRTRGCNVRLSSNKCIAERNSNYYSQGYVFSQRPLNVGEKMVIQILKTDERFFAGSLAFGLTTCDPSTVNVIDLPQDSHHLLDRREYWVVVKDVANSPMEGDEIAFSITESGEVQMTKNRQRPITLMHVDVSQRLWGFFDLYGSTLKVRLLGTQFTHSACRVASRPQARTNRPLNSMHSMSLHNVHKAQQIYCPPASLSSKRSSVYQSPYATYKPAYSEKQLNAEPHQTYQPMSNSAVYQTHEPKAKSIGSSDSGSLNSFGNECLVCCEQPINSVLYTCGHVFMCYACSVKQWQTSGHCPICRAKIQDVIRTYWS